LITNDNVATEKLGNSDVLLVRSTTGRTVDALLQSFKETKKKYSAFIDYAEPDYIIRLDSLATDPTDNPDLAKQWGLKRISALSAWQVPTDGNVVVAVIDSGIDYDHEDLKDNVWCSPPNFTVQMGGKPIKCPTGSHGFDVTVPETESDDKKCDPASDIGHGTHVAGIIGAADNNHGGVGVAPKIKILAVKYADNHGAGCVSDVVRALDFIVEASKSINIRVINCSFGFYIEDLYACSSNSQTLQAALQRVDGRNIIIVASNGDVPCDTSKIAHYPSGYYLPNLIAVTATDEKDNKDLYCCGYDSTSPQLIGAPGMYIWSTLPTNTYGYLIGTSMATSFVSGAAALILSDTRDGCDKLIATKLRSDLLIEADHAEKGNLANYIMEGRRLNVDRAIKTCSNYLK
jgi:subtilisin family serine protease